jgi:hydrogenase maturation protease
VSTLVLGIGNVLLTDEGVGIRALKELERRFVFSGDVELLDGGTSGIELLRHIQRKDNLIIIDAMTCDQPPGTIYRLENQEVPAVFRTRISPHQLGLSDLLAAAMLTDDLPKNLVLFGVEPESVDIGLELTTSVENSLGRLITSVVEELRKMGCTAMPQNTSFSGKACFWETAKASLNT